MPWTTTDPLRQRILFIGAAQERRTSFKSLCASFGITRKTGYKWLRQFDRDGPDGLADRSRRPLSNCRALPASVIDRFVKLRQSRPTWGPRKLIAWVAEYEPLTELPAASTVGELLKMHGLVRSRAEKRRWRGPARSAPLRNASFSNAVWSMDFKGWFRLGDRTKCEPFTVTDNFSRYLLEVRAFDNQRSASVWSSLVQVFEEFGMPDAFRFDNGQPWVAPKGGLHLTTLSVKLLRLRISLERIARGKPQQNGRHERMHLTLKQDTTAPAAATLRGQQRRFDAFKRLYNEERPHEALSQRPPISVYRPSLRRFPQKLPQPEYPNSAMVHRVDRGGKLRIGGREYFLSTALIEERVGIYEIDDGCFEVQFCDEVLGHFHRKHPKTGLVFS